MLDIGVGARRHVIHCAGPLCPFAAGERDRVGVDFARGRLVAHTLDVLLVGLDLLGKRFLQRWRVVPGRGPGLWLT